MKLLTYVSLLQPVTGRDLAKLCPLPPDVSGSVYARIGHLQKAGYVAACAGPLPPGVHWQLTDRGQARLSSEAWLPTRPEPAPVFAEPPPPREPLSGDYRIAQPRRIDVMNGPVWQPPLSRAAAAGERAHPRIAQPRPSLLIHSHSHFRHRNEGAPQMATRLKTKTLAAVPQSKNDCAEQIRQLGDLQRQFERERGAMNDAIAAITQTHQPALEDLTTRINALQSGVQAWCEAHRAELCAAGGKTAQLITGEVSWRQRPPSITIRGVETVLETLQRLQLDRFIRSKLEPNKDAMLAEPDVVRGIAGITLVTGAEDFIVRPFEVALEAA